MSIYQNILLRTPSKKKNMQLVTHDARGYISSFLCIYISFKIVWIE